MRKVIPNRCGWQGLACLGVGLLAAQATGWLRGAEQGETVVVVYNSAVPQSKEVADYYAQRRQVPENQVLGLKLPTGETMTRPEYAELLEQPLWKEMKDRKLLTVVETNEAKTVLESATASRVVGGTVRYVALCYGVPTRILEDKSAKEEGFDEAKPELRRNEASVDSELACLPRLVRRLTGPAPNPLYAATNASMLDPRHGMLMVARLDGPSAAVAKGLVDKAISAETNGLWGRAYFDARGLKEGDYKMGDDWIIGSARMTRRMGFETVLDENPETFTVGFPMSQIAFYAGWYDGAVSGPFTRPRVEFMPGAIAYHLHSFSAQTIRSEKANWVGPLLAKGATATMGSVAEPYLLTTPDLPVFFSRLIYLRFSFGEAAYAAQSALSWQNIAVGDPLYRPFGRRPDLTHRELELRKSPLLEWSHLRVMDLNLATGASVEEVLRQIRLVPNAKQSAVLMEKVADIYQEQKQLADAIETYEQVLRLDPSPQQKVRVLLTLGKLLSYYGKTQKAFDAYEQLLKDGYPEELAVYQKLLLLAEDLGKPEVIERCRREVKRLSGGS